MRAPVLPLVTLLALTVAACSSPDPRTASDTAPPSAGESATNETDVATIENMPLGELEWAFFPQAMSKKPVTVPLKDGTATVNGIAYTLGDPVYADADADGDLDAAAPLSALDGNGFDEQWYIWLDTGDGSAQQVLWPIARTERCGDVTRSVKGVDDGFRIKEARYGLEDQTAGTSCADLPVDRRIRTVSIVMEGPDGEAWPVQTKPIPSFGGICQTSTVYDADSSTEALRLAPSADSPVVTDGDAVFSTQDWPIYERFGNWHLVGFVTRDHHFGCGWFDRG